MKPTEIFFKNTKYSRVTRTKPLLSAQNVEKRLIFATEYMSLSPEYCDEVIFSDETKIMLYYHIFDRSKIDLFLFFNILHLFSLLKKFFLYHLNKTWVYKILCEKKIVYWKSWLFTYIRNQSIFQSFFLFFSMCKDFFDKLYIFILSIVIKLILEKLQKSHLCWMWHEGWMLKIKISNYPHIFSLLVIILFSFCVIFIKYFFLFILLLEFFVFINKFLITIKFKKKKRNFYTSGV